MPEKFMRRSLIKSEIILVISSLNPGGAEKVMVLLANEAIKIGIKVHLIVLTKGQKFYPLNKEIKVYEPDFVIGTMSRLTFFIKNYFWLRKQLKNIGIKEVLSFSGKYNSYVILASLGLGKKVFISDRSKPGISYGKAIDILNSIFYKYSSGIIAQTKKAAEFALEKFNHKNIKVIPNPVSIPDSVNFNDKKDIILNVGRFITTKHQNWLLNYFKDLNINNWDLIFIGDGPNFEGIKSLTDELENPERIQFKGLVKNINNFYHSSSIFAFTSTSEGFPNALAEAMAYGCACISFDCIAGPGDLIEDGKNGFLIPEGDHSLYKEKLKCLIENPQLRLEFGKNAIEKVKNFSSNNISEKYLEFILNNENSN